MTRPSDLPPGVGVNDLPGNRPEDDEWEHFVDRLATLCESSKIEMLDLGDPAVERFIGAVHTLSFTLGFEQGRAEGEIDAAAKFAPPDLFDEPPAPEGWKPGGPKMPRNPTPPAAEPSATRHLLPGFIRPGEEESC